jgi:NitT/TauT family transport system permease protein
MPSLTRSRILTRQPTFSRSQVLVRTWPYLLDLLIAAAGLATFYAVLMVARNWMGIAQPSAEIHLVPRALPLYALYSVIRIFIAYLLSLGFAVGYGYVAAYNPRVEPLMVAVLDILQSIPVLSFLPPVMLAMVALIPTRQLGLELGAILLIFTGQVWNMAFSFYSSLKSMPKELREASDIYKFSAWQRFWQLEMPFSAIGLVWNSMVSVAGGWFALIACEMFTLGAHDFRLPGLGSYLQTSASQGDTTAMVWGLAVMLIIIVVTDQLLWRPLITWSDRFKFENVESQRAPRSRVLEILQQSRALHAISQNTLAPLSERIYHSLGTRHVLHPVTEHKAANRAVRIVLSVFAVLILAALLVYSASHALLLLKDIRGHQLLHLLGGAAATFLRVQIALVLAAAWTIPAGVAIGFNPRLARICQPIAQIAASFPATTLFPIMILAVVQFGGGLGIASILLMLLGTQWYILFNVIAGAMAIPSEMKEVATLFHFTSWQRWQTVILPGIFPFLITGMVTASGGAWNASIFAEYFRFKGRIMTTTGLGAQIAAATDDGQFSVLLAATILISLMVVTVNRLVWRPLYKLAETRYRLDA